MHLHIECPQLLSRNLQNNRTRGLEEFRIRQLSSEFTKLDVEYACMLVMSSSHTLSPERKDVGNLCPQNYGKSISTISSPSYACRAQ